MRRPRGWAALSGKGRKPSVDRQEPPATADPESTWFWEHYDSAASQIVDSLAAVGISMDGQVVADVGCGDGIMALGVAHRAGPDRLVGYDINPVSLTRLRQRAIDERVSDLPRSLAFERCTSITLPAADATYDIVYTWSAFEHVERPIAVLTEIRRVLHGDGVLFLQLWPFYHADRGSHLWDWFPEPFHHLDRQPEEVVEEMRGGSTRSPEWTEMMGREFMRLNRVTLDELQRCLLASGLSPFRVELITSPIHIPRELARYPLSQLAISGVKLLARPT